MRNRIPVCGLAGALLALLIPFAGQAFAQGGTTSTISGVVVDVGGGVIPGADVTIKQAATGTSQSTVTNAQGVFSFPGLNIGTYSVTVTLAGFKTFIANNVVITSGSPANVKATLEVGGLSETVQVTSTAEIVQTQATTVASTITTNQITKLPLTTRSAMDFVTFLPGVSTPGGNRQSTVNGLPQGLINITLDGVNIQDNTLRSTDGFFAIVAPRLDAVEEVSVTTATQGAESAQGAVQIKFVTRSGTNTFSGSAYEYYRRDKLNANTWFNERDNVAKAKLTQDQFGVRAGGPIYIPKLFDGRNKAFFFFNLENQRQPSDTTRQRTLLNTAAQSGIYSYISGGTVQQVNLLALAAANGQTSTVDPKIAKLLGDIRSAVTGGSLTDLDPNLQRFSYNVPVESNRFYPTVRIDWNISTNHRFSSAWNYQNFTDAPDTLNNRDAQFPGFPVDAGQTSIRQSWSNSIRSTFKSNLVNEARIGYSSSPVKFFTELTPSMWSGPLADQGGFQLTLGTIGTALTNASAAPSPQSRDASSLLIEDTINWLKGKHSMTMGGSFTQYTYWGKNSALVPSIGFGVVTGDPATGMFSNTTNFPGAASTNISAAQNLYALLTGRVASITGDARIDETTNKYVYMGTGMQRTRMNEMGLYFQDSWRWKPTFTVNAGLRYDLQFPFYPLNDFYSTGTYADLCGISGVGSDGQCNLFMPGVLTGKQPQFVQYTKGTKGYNMDVNNVAPNVGFAWTLGGQSGFMGALLGGKSGDSVVRGAYSRGYTRNGMNDFSGRYALNPGGTIAVSRSVNLGNLGTLPLLFRNPSLLGPPPFPESPVYPMTDVITQDISMFDQNIKVPYADSYTFGWQRSIGHSMAVEVRYVGTRSRLNWANVNYNEINIYENKFLDEFRLAQANLQANLAAGRGATFKYFGAGTGTAPLPTMLAYFSGVPAANAGDSSLYTSSNFTNATYLARLATYNPNPFGLANDLYTNSGFRTNASTAGIPVNFFLMNPDLQGGAVLTKNRDYTNFNGLQLELRRRYSQGLQFSTSYAYGYGEQSRFRTLRKPLDTVRRTGNTGDVTHAFKANVVYDLPFGHGRKFGNDVNGLVDRFINGWTVGLAARIQSGWLIDLGNVRLVGMSAADVSKMFKIRKDSTNKVYMLPEDVINESIKAFSVSATSLTGYGTLGAPSGRYFAPANGPDCIEPDNGAQYGNCGVRSLVAPGPIFQQYDLSFAKRIEVVKRQSAEFRLEVLNLFNNVNFVPVGGIGNQLTGYEVTSLTGTNTSRTVQLVFRYNW